MIYLSKGGAGADSDHTWIRPCTPLFETFRILSKWSWVEGLWLKAKLRILIPENIKVFHLHNIDGKNMYFICGYYTCSDAF